MNLIRTLQVQHIEHAYQRKQNKHLLNYHVVESELLQFKYKLVSKYLREEDTDFSLLVFWTKNLPIIRSIIILFQLLWLENYELKQV